MKNCGLPGYTLPALQAWLEEELTSGLQAQRQQDAVSPNIAGGLSSGDGGHHINSVHQAICGCQADTISLQLQN